MISAGSSGLAIRDARGQGHWNGMNADKIKVKPQEALATEITENTEGIRANPKWVLFFDSL